MGTPRRHHGNPTKPIQPDRVFATRPQLTRKRHRPMGNPGRRPRGQRPVLATPHRLERLLAVDLPTFAVFLRQEFIRGFVIRDFEISGVPFERLASPVGHIPEQIVLNQ